VSLPNGPETVKRFFAGTGGSYDRISSLCTFGADRWWKRKILEKIPRGSTAIMDQACGTGILSLKIARRFPSAAVVGVDMTPEYLDVAREKAERAGVKNVRFFLGRAEDTEPSGMTFDCITSSYLAKYADLELLVAGFGRMLKNGAVVVVHDFTYPANRPFAKIWEFYFLILQTVGARVYPEWNAAFQGLPKLLRQSSWPTELEERLERSGFSDITTDFLTIGTAAIVTARKAR
jgi:demethylmenaquinone methyltransferase/2-methoxy-6-polyprenyl-1,4-benzoquinol methylase